MRWTTSLRRILCVLPIAAFFASCSPGAPNPALNITPTATGALPLIPTVPAKVATVQLPTSTASPTIQSSVVPATSTSIPTASPAPPTSAPTIVPTLAPPTPTISPAAALVGPEWSIAALGDQNQDGLLDVVAYKPATIAARVALPGFTIVASELVVVQQGINGPEVQLAANNREIVAANALLARFPNPGGPAAFQLQVGLGAIGIVPLNGTGDVAALGAAIIWNAGANGYRATALAGAPAVNAGLPLVGPEWQIAIQGDLSGNGRRDLVAYKPGPAVALQSGYALSVAELVIVEEGLLGQTELQLSLNRQRLLVPGQTLVEYPAQILPGGFLASFAQTGPLISFAPFDTTGQLLTKGARIAWNQAAQGYRPLDGSELLPPQRALLGPEWTVAFDGDANRDGRRDLIGYKPAGIQVRPPNPAYRLVAAEVVVVQENRAGPYGDPEVQLAVNTREIIAPNVPLFTYRTSDPNRMVGAFLLNVNPGSADPIALLPVNTAGVPLNELAISAYWDSGVSDYRLRSAVAISPTPAAPTPTSAIPTLTPSVAKPLVGAEWSLLAQGDFNGDGRRDVIAYKPGSLAARTTDSRMPLTVSELVIVQEGANGQSELQLSITSTLVIVPGRIIQQYAPPSNGFQVGVVEGRPGALIFVPIGPSGEQLGQPVIVTWNAGQGLYLP